MILRDDKKRKESSHDFGKDIIPGLIQSSRVYGYQFGGASGRVTADRYWRDVGTIDAYYEANMDLLEPVPSMDLYQENWPIRTFEYQSPPARTVQGASGKHSEIVNSILCSGVIVSGGSVRHSVLSPNVRVDDEALVDRSILFDGVSIGAGARIKNCVVDKYVKIPPGESIGYDTSLDNERFTVSPGGIIVVPKNYQFSFESQV